MKPISKPKTIAEIQVGIERALKTLRNISDLRPE